MLLNTLAKSFPNTENFPPPRLQKVTKVPTGTRTWSDLCWMFGVMLLDDLHTQVKLMFVLFSPLCEIDSGTFVTIIKQFRAVTAQGSAAEFSHCRNFQTSGPWNRPFLHSSAHQPANQHTCHCQGAQIWGAARGIAQQDQKPQTTPVLGRGSGTVCTIYHQIVT